MEDPKKILIIEDETSLRDVLVEKFQKKGYVALQAKNGLEGLNMALSEHPDMILLDLVMPQMDGVTMLSKLRGDEWGSTARVIILSNLNDATKISEATAQECYDYLVKSDWHINDVVAKVEEKLR